MRTAAADTFAVRPPSVADRLSDLCGSARRAVAGVQRRDARHAARHLIAGLLAVGAALAGLGPALAGGPPAAAAAVGGTAPAAGTAGHPAEVFPFVAPPGGTIPSGKGMWLNHLSRSAGGDAGKIVHQAKAAGLTHLYVRVGSSVDGFYAGPDLERLLPAAHAAGLKVIGWDFVYLGDPVGDAGRGRMEAWYSTATGDRLDGLAADIETEREGVHLSAAAAQTYGAQLREGVGPGYPLIAVVPRPNPLLTSYPFGDVVAHFDAVAPMVYWGHQDPAALVTGALRDLAPLGKPILPIGQAYDPALDGGAPGAPAKADIAAFIDAASRHGATAVSFWVWETATADHWAGIGEAKQLS